LENGKNGQIAREKKAMLRVVLKNKNIDALDLSWPRFSDCILTLVKRQLISSLSTQERMIAKNDQEE